MDFIGLFKGMARDDETNRFQITILINEDDDTVVNAVEELYSLGAKLRVHIAKWRKKRSLDANSYMWALLTKMATALDSSKEEVYEEMLKSYGVLKYDEHFQPSKMKLSYDEDPRQKPGHWMFNRDLELYDGDGNPFYFKEYIEIKGSSEYDTAEMTHLLDGIIYEAKGLGIKTEPENEYQAMLNEYAEEYAKAHKYHYR